MKQLKQMRQKNAHANAKERVDWLIFFRRAKCQDTLDMMLDAALAKTENVRDKANAILAAEDREVELATSIQKPAISWS